MPLQTGGLAFQLEGDDDGESDYSEVHGEPEPGEERPFVCAVVAGVRGSVFEEQSAEEWQGEENVLVFLVSVARHQQ